MALTTELVGENTGADPTGVGRYLGGGGDCGCPAAGLPLITKTLAPASPRKQGYAGLYNQGNTCYLNSLIQGLYATPEVRTSLYSLSAKDLVVETNEAEPEAPVVTESSAPTVHPPVPVLTSAEKEALELLTSMVRLLRAPCARC